VKQNEFFNEMDRIGRAWSMKHREHEKLKEEIIATKGWDSDELKSWYEKEKRMEFPFPAGASKAFRAWEYSEGDEVEMSDFCWEREVDDFVKTLCKAGLDSFVFTNQSTAVMENIHQFVAAGCTLEGPCTLVKKINRWGEETEEQVIGLRFHL